MPLAAIFAVLGLQAAQTCQTYLLADPAPALFSNVKSSFIELAPISTDLPWTEAIPSWNVSHPEKAELTIEARVLYPDHATKFYSFGTWSGSNLIGARASVKGQKD